MKSILVAALAAALCCGCAGYRWNATVPPARRTVAVPTFRNGSKVTELGDVVTRQVLRELQREGTFKLAAPDEAAIEIQGSVVEAGGRRGYGDRGTNRRLNESDFNVAVKVSVIDKISKKVLIDSRKYVGHTVLVAGDDLMTARRDASGRVAEDIARQIVDDLLDYQW